MCWIVIILLQNVMLLQNDADLYFKKSPLNPCLSLVNDSTRALTGTKIWYPGTRNSGIAIPGYPIGYYPVFWQQKIWPQNIAQWRLVSLVCLGNTLLRWGRGVLCHIFFLHSKLSNFSTTRACAALRDFAFKKAASWTVGITRWLLALVLVVYPFENVGPGFRVLLVWMLWQACLRLIIQTVSWMTSQPILVIQKLNWGKFGRPFDQW